MKTNSIFLYAALILTLLFQCMISTAQSPQKISYQSVIRNASGELVRSTTTRIQISILKGTATGIVMYKELHTATTNINGLATLEVGKGTPLTGTFSSIDWSQGPYFMKVENGFASESGFDITGISEILSVPYSLYAKKAEKADSVTNEKDPFFNASVAKNITAADTIRWNGSISSYDEIDPIFAADSSYIKTGVRNWNSSLAITIDAADTTHWGRAETDPLFSTWNKSTGITITESQITDLDHFTNTDEIDPRYAADSSFVKSGVRDWNSSLAKTIDAADTTHWGRAETDPLFSTWNKSTGITITESQITDLDHFTNTDEIDPRYSADSSFVKSGVRDWNSSLAKTIDAADTTHWGRAETDPLFSTWNKSTGITITESQITDLDHFTNTDEIDPRYAADSSFVKSGVREWNSSLAKTIDAADTTHWGRAETDPLFSTWNKSTGITITESQITDLDHFTNTDEIDPRYATDSSFIKSGVRDWNSSLAKTFDAADTSHWGRAETDPLFSTWNKSTGITITESQITDLDHFTNTDEIDPRYATDSSFVKSGVRDWNSSLAKSIDAADTTHWGRAETDPVFTLSAANSIIDAGSGAVITSAERTKLDGIEEGAEVNVQADWNQTTTTADDYIKNKPSFDTAVNFSGSLSGDVTGTQSATVVAEVGGVTATNIATGANLANAATNSNTASTIVKRDASGNFTAGTITASGLAITGGTPGAGKVLTSDASGNATWQAGGSSSTFKEITRSRFKLTDLDGAYILNGQSLGENDSIADYRNHFIAPYNGKLLKIVVKSEVAMGSTVISMHVNRNTTALETQTVDVATANTANTFTFSSSAVFNAGDDVELFVDPTEFVASTSSSVSFTIVWEY